MKPNFLEIDNGIVINLNEILFFSRKEVTFENRFITIDSDTYQKIKKAIVSIA